MKKTEKRNRIMFDATPETKAAIKLLSKRWNMKSNDAIARAILESLHRPLASSPKPPWATEIQNDLKNLTEMLLEYIE